jgi:hypothetical protein
VQNGIYLTVLFLLISRQSLSPGWRVRVIVAAFLPPFLAVTKSDGLDRGVILIRTVEPPVFGATATKTLILPAARDFVFR